MAIELIIVLGVVLMALILFTTNILPIDVTAILIMVALMVTGVLAPDEGLSGFSNPATLSILALLIISQGLKDTGAVDALGDQVLKITGKNEVVSLLSIMVIASVCSAFINTTAVVAVFIPVVIRIAKQYQLSKSVLLIPLSFAAMVGGASTMIGTSTNLLINALARKQGQPPFGIFDLTPLGILLLACLVIYMLTIGRRLLKRNYKNSDAEDNASDNKFFITELEVLPGSELIGQKIKDLKLSEKTPFEEQKVMRNNKELISVNSKIKEGDVLIVNADIHEIVGLNNRTGLRVLTNKKNEVLPTVREVGKEESKRILFESLVVPNSYLIGKMIRDVDFSRFYNAFPLGVRKIDFTSRRKLMDHRIKVGDVFLMDGRQDFRNENTAHDWLIVQEISRDYIEDVIFVRRKMLLSIIILALVIGLAVTGMFPIVVSAWLGAALMFITGCISIDSAYKNIQWKVVFLLAGIIPLGLALEKTGGDQLMANFLIGLTDSFGLGGIVSALFLITVLITAIISNQATAVLLVPVALQMASIAGLPPEPLLIAILFGANTSFVTPVGYQTNAMVYGPGNYSFKDYIIVGGGVSLIFWMIITFLVPVFY